MCVTFKIYIKYCVIYFNLEVNIWAWPPEEMEGPAADAILSPEEELDGYEPEPLGRRPAVLPLLELAGEASSGPGMDGSLPSTPPPAEEEEDELYRQSLEIISRYLREQATGAKDANPLGGARAASREALETLRRVGDGAQRSHGTAFQGKRGVAAAALPCFACPGLTQPRWVVTENKAALKRLRNLFLKLEFSGH